MSQHVYTCTCSDEQQGCWHEKMGRIAGPSKLSKAPAWSKESHGWKPETTKRGSMSMALALEPCLHHGECNVALLLPLVTLWCRKGKFSA